MPEEKKKSFREQVGAFMPFFRTHRQLLVNTGGIVVLVLIIFVLTTNLGLAMKERSDAEAQIASMESFVEGYKRQVQDIKAFPKSVSDAKDVDRMQSTVMMEIQSSNLDLISMKEELQNSGEHGRAFTANFQGSYEDTMSFLVHLHESDKLIGVKYLKMDMREGRMDTVLTYKIYSK